MKTINFTPKTLLVGTAIFALSFTSFNTSAQEVNQSQTNEGIIWSQIKNFDEIEFYEYNHKLFSNNTEIQTLINDFSINKIERALPASRNEVLHNVAEITCDCNETDLLVAISRLPNVFTQPEIGPHYQTLSLPDDYNVSFAQDYALDLINADQAWDVTHGDSSIIIAVSDQNFFTNHEELVGKVHFYDSTNTSIKVHGTAVAVTAAGNTNNTIGKSSIGYDSELALYRMSYNDIIIASNNGYRVINTSWSSGCNVSSYVQGVIDEVYNNGSIVVAAAGNGGTCGGPSNLVYPAACNHVISVTSIGINDNHERVAGDSLSTFQHNSDVDISAPGYSVALTSGLGNYITGNGSSFSAPYVSGTIALMLSVDSCLTFENVETILYTTSDNIDSLNPQYAGLIGSGRLNAGAAVTMASTFMSCTSGGGGNPRPVVNEGTDENLESLSIATYTTVGVEDIENGNFTEIKVFPNPSMTGGSINIESSTKMESCEITNVSGEIIQTLKPTSENATVQNLTQGTYFVRINLENGITKINRIVVL